jgi:hypothetical protein
LRPATGGARESVPTVVRLNRDFGQPEFAQLRRGWFPTGYCWRIQEELLKFPKTLTFGELAVEDAFWIASRTVDFVPVAYCALTLRCAWY